MDDKVVLSLIRRNAEDLVNLHASVIEQCLPDIAAAAKTVIDSLRFGGKVIFFGNGGSAADAQHLVGELVGRFIRDREPLSALALTTNTSILTSIGNDFGCEHVFERQIRALGRRGDVAIAISTSGRSSNVNYAVSAAKAMGISTIALTGGTGGDLRRLVDICIIVPSDKAPRVQECHIAIGHSICELVDMAAAEGYLRPKPHNTGILPSKKIVSINHLSALSARLHSMKRMIVWTNGCFDILHPGHLSSLQAAKALGDVLVVGVNSDEAVRSLKGTGRPVLSEADRAAMLAALECVDYVIIFNDPTPARCIELLKPAISCKGSEYAPPDGKPVPEAPIVEIFGGRMIYLPLVPGFSTTALIERTSEKL